MDPQAQVTLELLVQLLWSPVVLFDMGWPVSNGEVVGGRANCQAFFCSWLVNIWMHPKPGTPNPAIADQKTSTLNPIPAEGGSAWPQVRCRIAGFFGC